jgi:drug/metabolite transporter (DMT)-like permease
VVHRRRAGHHPRQLGPALSEGASPSSTDPPAPAEAAHRSWQDPARLTRLALGAAVASVAIQAFGPVFVRKSGWNGVVFAFQRLWMAALLYLAVSALRGARPTLHTLRVSAPGGLWFAFNVCTFFIAVNNTTIANASVIGALQPIALMLVSYRLFGERVRTADLGLTLVAIAGVALVVFSHGTTSGSGRLGDLSAFASMLGYAAYYVASKQARTSLTTLEYQTSLTIVAVVAVGVAVLVSRQDLSAPAPSAWFWAAMMVALPGTGHLLTNFAHAHVRISVLGAITLLSPVGAVIVAWIVFGESLSGWQIAGMGVVLASLALLVAASARATGQAKPAAPATAR